jgi:hypothetical protein
LMKRFVEGEDRRQGVLLPEFLDDYVGEDNPVRAIDVFVDELDLRGLGFSGVVPEVTGRPAYRPATLLKIYLYGYLNRIQSSRRLERETQRNIELMWRSQRPRLRHATRSTRYRPAAGRSKRPTSSRSSRKSCESFVRKGSLDTREVERMSVRGATDAFSRSPLSLAFCPFIRPALKGSSGSN